MPEYYRIKNTLNEEGIRIQVEIWNVISETPKGYWVRFGSNKIHEWENLKRLKERKLVRFVKKGDYRKRHCYPTIEEAINSFRIRKQWQMDHYKRGLDQTEHCLKEFDQYKNRKAPFDINIGHTELTEQIVWDY